MSFAAIDNALAEERLVTFRYDRAMLAAGPDDAAVAEGFRRIARRVCDEEISKLAPYSVKRDCIDDLLSTALGELDRRRTLFTSARESVAM